jgi:hypothetical protein
MRGDVRLFEKKVGDAPVGTRRRICRTLDRQCRRVSTAQELNPLFRRAADESSCIWPPPAGIDASVLGMLWCPTTFDECVATVHAAIAAGINLLDLAPRCGDGKADEAVGAAFGGRLPDGVCVTSKCNLGEPPPDQIEGILRRSIEASLKRLRLTRLGASGRSPTKRFVEDQVASPSSWKTPRMAAWMAS